MVRCSRFGVRFWKAPRGPFHPEVSRHHRALLLWKWLTTCAAGCWHVGQGYGRFIAEYCPWVTVTSLCWHLDGLQRTVESIKNICLQSFERKSGLLRNTLCGFSRYTYIYFRGLTSPHDWFLSSFCFTSQNKQRTCLPSWFQRAYPRSTIWHVFLVDFGWRCDISTLLCPYRQSTRTVQGRVAASNKLQSFWNCGPKKTCCHAKPSKWGCSGSPKFWTGVRFHNTLEPSCLKCTWAGLNQPFKIVASSFGGVTYLSVGWREQQRALTKAFWLALATHP